MTVPARERAELGVLRSEIVALQQRLEEAEETLRAIRHGEVDAFLIEEPKGDRVYTLQSADKPYRLLVESMQQGALVLDLDGTILFANPQFSRLIGARSESLLAGSIEDLVEPGSRTVIRSILREAMVGPSRGELALARAGGGAVDVYLTAAPLPPIGSGAICAVVTDLTERKQHEDLQRTQVALLESEARLRAVFEQATVGIAEVDLATGRFLRTNQAYAELTGYSPDELREMVASSLLPEGDTGRADDPDGESRGERIYIRKDGAQIVVDRNSSILRDRDGRPSRGLEIVADITERRRAEAELRVAARRKDEFLATLAHELRNPLAPLRNAAQVLHLKAATVPEVSWARGIIDRQIQQMTRLVDDLLDLSRISRNQVSLHPEVVELSKVINTAVETSAPLIEQARHQLVLRIPPEPIHLYADLTRLAQVFSNLLNNAAKYTDPGGLIEVVAEEAGGTVSITVRDNGSGIPPELLPRVFEMFAQVDRTLERSQSGLGIGLALVKGFVEMHDGTIVARSDGRGAGSEFTVALPTRLAPLAPLPRRSGDGQMAANLPRFRVLIVDDNRDSADSLAMILNLWGQEVETAYSGVAGLARARDFEPDLVLLDLGMPELNGFDACRQLRTMTAGRQPIVVAVTGWSQEEDRRRTKAAGFDLHLVKPADPDVLVRLLTEMSGRRDTGVRAGV